MYTAPMSQSEFSHEVAMRTAVPRLGWYNNAGFTALSVYSTRNKTFFSRKTGFMLATGGVGKYSVSIFKIYIFESHRSLQDLRYASSISSSTKWMICGSIHHRYKPPPPVDVPPPRISELGTMINRVEKKISDIIDAPARTTSSS